jgi:hypothetical protein
MGRANSVRTTPLEDPREEPQEREGRLSVAPAPSPGKRSTDKEDRKRTSDEGTRPTDWLPCPEDIAFAKDNGFPSGDITIEFMVEKFRNHWLLELGGPDARKSDWWWSARWRNWVMDQATRFKPASRPNGSGWSKLARGGIR